MARQTFQIDPAQLRRLREELGKTQEELGFHIRQLRAKPSSLDNEDLRHSVISTYQRIERTGKTSQKTAEKLADYFNVDVAVLQGLKPLDTIQRVMALLRSRLLEGASTDLKHAYEKNAKGLEGWSDEEKLRELAREIAQRLESAQWSRDPSELAALAALTGMSQKEMLTPAYVRGYWWIIDSWPSETDARVVSGANSVGAFVKEAWEKHPPPGFKGYRTTVRLSRRGYRYRFEAEVYGIHSWPWWIESIRCEPDEDKGVRWSHASHMDQEFVESNLRAIAFQNADVVYDFDDKVIPADPLQLRFVVSLRSRNQNYAWQNDGQLIFGRSLHDEPKEMLDRWTHDGSGPLMLLGCLWTELKSSLHPHLKAYGAECWEISKDTVAIDSLYAQSHAIKVALKQPNQKNRLLELLGPGREYHIALMTEDADGKLMHAPWKGWHVDYLMEEIKKWIDAPLPEGGYGDEIQFFEPRGETK